MRGFSLVELMIAFTILGILALVTVRGYDLIESMKIKRFVIQVKSWENSVFTFYARKGRYPGDQDKNGVIGDATFDNVRNDLTKFGFIYPPYEGSSGNEENVIRAGTSVFYIFLGHYEATNQPKRNVLVLCRNKQCNSLFQDPSEVRYLEALDTVVDGVGNVGGGQVVPSYLVLADHGSWTAQVKGIYNAQNWYGCYAAVYFFDSKRQ